MQGHQNKRGRSELSWCIDMLVLRRAPALTSPDTFAQHGFDLLPESIVAQRVISGRYILILRGMATPLPSNLNHRTYHITMMPA